MKKNIDNSSQKAAEHIKEILTKVISELKSLSDSPIPPALKNIGFKNSLEELFESYLLTQTFDIKLFFEEALDSLDQDIQISLFRIIQEQLNNILKHAKAKNTIISLSISDQIYLFIKDDGIGFDTAIKRQGAGFPYMRSRAGLYGGTIRVISQPGKGCTLAVMIPNKNIR